MHGFAWRASHAVSLCLCLSICLCLPLSSSLSLALFPLSSLTPSVSLLFSMSLCPCLIVCLFACVCLSFSGIRSRALSFARSLACSITLLERGFLFSSCELQKIKIARMKANLISRRGSVFWNGSCEFKALSVDECFLPVCEVRETLVECDHLAQREPFPGAASDALSPGG